MTQSVTQLRGWNLEGLPCLRCGYEAPLFNSTCRGHEQAEMKSSDISKILVDRYKALPPIGSKQMKSIPPEMHDSSVQKKPVK